MPNICGGAGARGTNYRLMATSAGPGGPQRALTVLQAGAKATVGPTNASRQLAGRPAGQPGSQDSARSAGVARKLPLSLPVSGSILLAVPSRLQLSAERCIKSLQMIHEAR